MATIEEIADGTSASLLTAADTVDAADLRADAQQNRQRILGAARAAFTASGDASLNSIAKAAGVGPGTLYRHFPSREDLILAVYERDVRALAESAGELLALHPPLRALRLWLERMADYGVTRHSVADALLHTATNSDLAGRQYAPVVGAVRTILSACEGDGTIGPGIAADDVLLLLAFVWRIDPGPGAAQRAGRLLDVIIAGLQAGAPLAPAHADGRRSARSSLRLPRWLSRRAGNRPRSQP
jgi:AcrR family transcriptional regulator